MTSVLAAHPASASLGRKRVQEQYRAHVNRGLATLATLTGAPVEYRSEGALVHDLDGTEYLDCGGYGVFLLGHRHPRVVSAVAEQLWRHPLSVRGALDPTLARACTILSGVAPGDMPYAALTNSGAEATELALKLGRLSGRRRVISTIGGFHGKSLGALSVTGRERFRLPAEPLLPGVEFVPYGDADALAAALRNGPPATVIVEPVQGEAGVIIPPAGYLARVREHCTSAGALLVVDEIQTGLGRLGEWWGCVPEGVEPDILLSGKILSGGVMPVGAVLGRAEVFAPLNADPLLHSSTYAGNPLAATAAATTIEVLEDEGLVDRAAVLGARLLREVRDLVTRLCPQSVVQVRGRGLLIGVECRDDGVAADLLARLVSRRILVSYSLNSGCVVRLTPPAVLRPEQMQRLLTELGGALTGLDDTLDLLSA